MRTQQEWRELVFDEDFDESDCAAHKAEFAAGMRELFTERDALLTKLSIIANTPREGEVMEGAFELRHERSRAAAYQMLDALIVQAREALIRAAQPKHAAQEGEAADPDSPCLKCGSPTLKGEELCPECWKFEQVVVG